MRGISNYILWVGLSLIIFVFSLSLWYNWSTSIKNTQLLEIQKNDLNLLQTTLSNVCDNGIGTRVCITFHYTKWLYLLNVSGNYICYQLLKHKKVCKTLLCSIKKPIVVKIKNPLISSSLSSRGYSLLNICIEKAGDTFINVTYTLE